MMCESISNHKNILATVYGLLYCMDNDFSVLCRIVILALQRRFCVFWNAGLNDKIKPATQRSLTAVVTL